MARAPQRLPLPKRAAEFDPFMDDPRLGGPLPARREPEPPENEKADVQAFIAAELETVQERTLAQFKRMRKKLRTPEGKIRRAKLIGSVIGLQLEGFKRAEIAAILGLTPMVVTRALRLARENATIADLLKKLDEETLPIAVDNIHQAVADGDLRMSTKLADGRGIFRTHKSIEAQISQTRIEIRLVTQVPASLAHGAPLPMVKAGSIQAGPPAIDVTPIKVEDVPVQARPA
jgi:hypothetical protein